ncbi:hypothetical protein FOZ61_005546 [Perkinsus olseni]|uniref:Uncharacterized protein n=1 Tax=Perkinsus olseni TaxID=32597 RepID=A0A7J6LGX1_PEROL|nr:hypothetical protein FOZ61_005546 [Perkinsus olseni]
MPVIHLDSPSTSFGSVPSEGSGDIGAGGFPADGLITSAFGSGSHHHHHAHHHQHAHHLHHHHHGHHHGHHTKHAASSKHHGFGVDSVMNLAASNFLRPLVAATGRLERSLAFL